MRGAEGLSPQAVRHRLAAVTRGWELRDRDAGDRHLQAALLPDTDRYRGAQAPALLCLSGLSVLGLPHASGIMAPGIKFMVLADPRQTGIDALLRKIYEIYSDFALKNPFYSLEMPIR